MLAAWLKISHNLATVLELIQSHFGRWRPLPETAGEIQNAPAISWEDLYHSAMLAREGHRDRASRTRTEAGGR
jgi:hypothetical protein